jgi:flagellar basal body rod protein FlgG
MIQGLNKVSTQYFQAPLQGMQRSVAQLNQAADKIAQGDVSPENIVSTMEAKIMFKANAQVVKTQDEMLGTLFNEKA